MKKEEVNHKERAHALLSASGSSRWLNCTPSARLEDGFPSKTSVFAEEGTLAHEMAELKLSMFQDRTGANQDPIYDALVELRVHELYAPDMDDYTEQYVDYVIETYNAAIAKDPAAMMFTETRVDFSEYVPDGFGTNDNAVIANKVLDVIDLKYGKGIKVSAVDNPQLKLYGIGALDAYSFMYDIEVVRLHIHQPRLDHVSVFEITVEELRAWGEEVKVQADIAFKGEGEQAPGDWCTFCKAKNRCVALAKEMESVAALDFSDPKLLTDKQLIEVYKISARMTKWLNGLSEYMLEEALSGKAWNGYKLVTGRSNRKIKDEDATIEALKADGWTDEDVMQTKIQSITALEKLVGKKQFTKLVGAFIDKPMGKPTLVVETDKRAAINLASDFDD